MVSSASFGLALTNRRRGKQTSDLTLATVVQFFPGVIQTPLAPRRLDDTAVFASGTIGCGSGARFVPLKQVWLPVREDQVARL